MSKTFSKIDDVIYKKTPQHWLKMTHTSPNEDRRISFDSDIAKVLESSRIRECKAEELINQYWNSTDVHWFHDGIRYDNRIKFNEVKDLVTRKYQHKFKHEWRDADGQIHTFYNGFWLVWHQGKIYWMTTYHYYPRCVLFEFNGNIDEEPRNSVKWTSASNLRLIFDVTNKKVV